MDSNYDRKIQEILKSEVYMPDKYEWAIKNAFTRNKSKSKYIKLIYKTIVATCCFFFAISGIVLATYAIYEKVWKTPTIVEQEEIEKEIEKIKEPITDEEKEKMISEEKIIIIGENILKTLGYEKMDFETIDIVKGYDLKSHYVLTAGVNNSKGIIIYLNTITGELEYFSDRSATLENIKCDYISEEKAKEIANDMYTKLNIINENDDYEIMYAKKQNIVSNGNVNDMWQISYAKRYNNIFDKDSAFTTVFTVADGKTIFYIIKGKNEYTFESNPVVISKDDAIKIASEKEKEFSSLEISEVNAKLSIEKMNIFIYALENNITNENGEYQVEDIPRNVWVVEIKHPKDTRPKNGDIDTVKMQYNKKYFVDATTGEIIGGEQAEFHNN